MQKYPLFQTYPAKGRLLFVWNAQEDLPPPEDLPAPGIAEGGADRWPDWSIAEWTIDSNCRAMVDHIYHFAPAHGYSSLK